VRLRIPFEDVYICNHLDSTDPAAFKSLVRPIRMWTDPENNLAFFVWDCHREETYYLGIFDLNQWYSHQTVGYIRYDTDTELSPYWVAIPLERPGS